jgi:hypothetical protein
VLLSFDAVADGVTAEVIVERVVRTVLAPRVSPGQDGPIVEDAPIAPMTDRGGSSA